MASPGNHTALCQLYRHTFVPCIEEGDAKLAERRSDMRLSRGEARRGNCVDKYRSALWHAHSSGGRRVSNMRTT